MSDIYIYRNCFTGDVSGGDIHMSGLINWITTHRNKYKVSLVSSSRDGQQYVYKEMNKINHLVYPSPQFSSPAILFGVRSLLSIFLIRLKLTSDQTPLVASSHFLPDVLPIFLKRKSKNKTVFIYHIVQDMQRVRSMGNELAKIQELICFSLIKRGFQKIIVDNDELVARLRSLGFTKQSILSSTNFVSGTFPRVDYEIKTYDLAFCGRLVRQKGIYEFLEVYETIRHSMPHIKATIMGSGPEENAVKRIIRDRMLDIEMTGYINDDEKVRKMASSKLFVFPSHEEGWGIVIAEAMSAGVPVIAYNLPAYKGIFGNHIKTVEIYNIDKLISTTHQALAFYSSNPKKYTETQDSLIDYAKKFNVDTVVPKEFEFIINGE